MTRAAWLEERRRGIGGSDLAAILGISPWSGPLDVWLDKTGRATGDSDSLRMRMGREMEPILKTLYEEETGRPTTKGELIVLDEKHMVGTPDLLADDRVVELKTVDPMQASNWGDPGSDLIPPYYLCQVQWYMMLTGKQICDLAALFGLNKFQVYTIKHSDTLAGVLEEAAGRFWSDFVAKDVQPPLDHTERTQAWLREKWPQDSRPFVHAEQADEAWAMSYMTADEELARAKEVIGTLKAKMQDRIADAQGVIGAGWKVQWKVIKDSTVIDWERVANDLWEKYLGQVPKAEIREVIEKATTIKKGFRRFNFYRLKGGKQ